VLSSTTMEQMTTLSESIEARVSKLLLSLVKIEKDKNSKPKADVSGENVSPLTDKYKNMYRKVLGFKMKQSSGKNEQVNDQEWKGGSEDTPPPTFPISELLQTLSKDLL